MSDTPRTDACEVRFTTLFAGEDAMWVPSKKAKEIERELNAANERIKRLEEAGDAYAAESCGCVCDGPCSHAPLYDKWIEAKQSQ